MKKINKRKHSVFFKIALSLGVSFATLFVTSITLIEVYKAAKITPEATQHVIRQNQGSDESLSLAFYDVASSNESMFSDSGVENFINATNKNEYLAELVKHAGISKALYKDLSIFYDGSFYNASGETFFIDSQSLHKLDEAPRSVIVIGSYKYHDSYVFTVGIKNQDLYCFYFLNSEILSALTELGIDNSITFITSEDFKVIISTDTKMINQFIGNRNETYVSDYLDNTYFAVKEKLAKTSNFGQDLYIYNYLPYSYVYGTINLLEIVLLSSLGVALFGVCFVALLRVRKITRPINALSKEISQLDLDNLANKSFNPKKDSKNEIEILQSSYYDMLIRIQNLLAKQHEDFELQRKLELDSLQTQINPHFLYNVLDAITWMAKINKQKNIEDFTINLAKFYRLSLHKGAKYITIKEEVEMVHYFMAIQLQRFPDMFTYKTETDPAIEDCMTLKLILQPFVENIIKYAFNFDYGAERNGEILVSAKKKDDKHIEFIVKDNGVGFNVDKVNKEKTINSPNGFGMKNVYERLKLEYKDDFTFKITSYKNKGTKVSIIIPMSHAS